MATLTTGRAPEKTESLRDLILESIMGRGCINEQGLEEPQLADKQPYSHRKTPSGPAISIGHSKLAFVLGHMTCDRWRLYFLYDGKTILKGDLEEEQLEALDGLFKAAARKIYEPLDK